MTPPPELARLRRRWAALWTAAGAFTAGGVWLLETAGGVPGAGLRWGLQAALVLIFVLVRLGAALSLNHPPGGGALRPTLGPANAISITRAFMVAAVAGFIGLQPPAAGAPAWTAWAPGGLYLCACALDLVDGVLARMTATETRLGEFLDTEIDAVGMMAASLVLFSADRAPGVFLLAGAGHFALKAAIRLRRRSGGIVHAVSARPAARLTAGIAMGVCGAAMLPACPPSTARLATWVMAAALLESFVRDWRVIRGAASGDGTPLAPAVARIEGLAARILPLALRAGILAAAAWVLGTGDGTGASTAGTIWLMAGAAGSVLGVAPRAAAMVLSVTGAGLTGSASSGLEAAALLACAVSLMVTGAGPACLWRPEERFLRTRLGARRAGRGAGSSGARA